MVCGLPAHDDARAVRNVLRGLVENSLDVGGNGAEVALIVGGVDVDDRLNRVVRNDRRAHLALDRRQAADDLRAVLRGRGNVLQRGDRIEPILRGLRDDRIGDAVLRVDPERRSDLEAAGQAVLQALGDVALVQADLRRAHTVDLDAERRIVERLLDSRVGDAGDARDFLQQLVGVGVVGGEIGADDLHVDRRGKAEVENLRHDVGGQEREGRARKGSRQSLAHLLDVAVRLAFVLGIDGDQDIGVGRTDGAGIVVSRN